MKNFNDGTNVPHLQKDYYCQVFIILEKCKH